jgi:putative endopeptidase
MKNHRTPILSLLGAALCAASFAHAQAPSIEPGDDFFAFANSQWMASTQIPADRSSWSANAELSESTNARIVKMIEALAADKATKGEARQVADFYSAYLDEAGIEAKGTAPLKPGLAAIAAIKDKTALARALGGELRADVDPLNSTNFFTENLFGLWVAQGLNDPAHNMAYLLQGGLGMPDRAYYLDTGNRMAALRTKYQAHIAAMLKLAGFDEVDTRAARVMALETAIAQSHATREDSADVMKANNTWAAKDFAARAPGMDWKAFFRAARLDGQKQFMVWHPGALMGAASLVESADLAAWKDYLAFHHVNHFGNTLPKAFVEQRFAFYGTALQGTPQMAVRSKRALGATNAAMDQAVGHLYADRYFSADDKARVKTMVANIIAAFSKRIEKLDWMAPATRAQAQEKLRTLYVGVGYPDRWKSYAGLRISPAEAFANAERAERFRYAQQVAKLGKAPDRSEWAMPPHLVNAVNLPLQNAMNFPAAKLQPPFFDPKASDAANYGSIGGTIGHEISHSFDDTGAQFDATGRLRDWWTREDKAHFEAAAAKLVAQYNGYKPFPDLAVNGQLTLSENLADLAGLAAAYDAFKAATGGKGGAEADKEFFLGNAQGKRITMREASARQQVLTDSHAPGQYRAATVRNIDAWYEAFGVKPGQKLYLAPAERVRVW